MGEESGMSEVIFFKNLEKFHDSLNYFNIESFAGKKIPVKLHMGESKNKYFPKPELVKHVIDKLKMAHVEPYLFDTTVAYAGLRNSKTGYLKLAKMHGFTEEKVRCGIVIDDKGIPITVENKEYEVAEHLVESTHIFALSHIKGHVATGMGGAIKNFGMGGVTKETKIQMHHGSRPIYQKDTCTYCGVCAEVCPFNALKVKENSWKQYMKSCFGCGVCVDACKSGSLTYKDADFQYVLACAARACVQDKNVIYLNEIKRISRSCDCDPFAGPIICPDIGYLVSDDPVAIDKASFDLVNNVKKNVFEKENNISPLKQIKYGEKIGLGSSKYQLIEI